LRRQAYADGPWCYPGKRLLASHGKIDAEKYGSYS
jgi:hypothetical protein